MHDMTICQKFSLKPNDSMIMSITSQHSEVEGFGKVNHDACSHKHVRAIESLCELLIKINAIKNVSTLYKNSL